VKKSQRKSSSKRSRTKSENPHLHNTKGNSMSINELIATSSVHAFNSGVESGRSLENERAINIVKDLIATACPCSKCETAQKILGRLSEGQE
jgi:hypothetical protein